MRTTTKHEKSKCTNGDKGLTATYIDAFDAYFSMYFI